VIDASGRVRSASRWNTATVQTGILQLGRAPAQPRTFYTRFGPVIPALLLAFALLNPFFPRPSRIRQS